MAAHCATSRSTSWRSSSWLAPSAAVRTMRPWPGGPHLVDDAAQALALVVVEALGDAEGRRVGHHDHEAPGQRDLLGEAGPLGPDGVLRDLAQDRLAGPQHLLDARPTSAPRRLDVLAVVADVAPVEHGVLGGADVDEGRFHARQDVLDPAPVDVAVDLGGVVGRPRHVVLDQGPALEHGDLGGVRADVDAHEVAPHRPSPALPAAAPARPAARRGAVASSPSSSTSVPSALDRRRPPTPGPTPPAAPTRAAPGLGAIGDTGTGATGATGGAGRAGVADPGPLGRRAPSRRRRRRGRSSPSAGPSPEPASTVPASPAPVDAGEPASSPTRYRREPASLRRRRVCGGAAPAPRRASTPAGSRRRRPTATPAGAVDDGPRRRCRSGVAPRRPSAPGSATAGARPSPTSPRNRATCRLPRGRRRPGVGWCGRRRRAGRAPPPAARRSYRTWGRSLLVLLTRRAPTRRRHPRGPP